MLIVINKHFEFFHLLISWIFVKRNEASTNTCACLQKKVQAILADWKKMSGEKTVFFQPVWAKSFSFRRLFLFWLVWIDLALIVLGISSGCRLEKKIITNHHCALKGPSRSLYKCDFLCVCYWFFLHYYQLNGFLTGSNFL